MASDAGGRPAAAHGDVRTFVDHGEIVETGERAVAAFKIYTAEREKASHLVVKAGDKVPIKSLDVQVVIARGSTITKALEGGRRPNSSCRDDEMNGPNRYERTQTRAGNKGHICGAACGKSSEKWRSVPVFDQHYGVSAGDQVLPESSAIPCFGDCAV